MPTKVVGRFIFVVEPPEFWLVDREGDYLRVEMPEGIHPEEVPLEVLLEIELDGNKVLSWKQ